MDGLTQEERDILESFERGEWRSVLDEVGAERYRGYARESLKKDKRINIRISSRDLQGLQRLAVNEGMPYQTLIASVLHKYVTGRLTERD